MKKKFNSFDYIFVTTLVVLVVYYGFRLFYLTPWYDELYTYYSFISRGPVFSAIHWPLPNNHVGYSVLSGFLDIFAPNSIGLRGISYLAALANVILIYKLCNQYFDTLISYIVVVIYVSMNLVNNLSVQGRGYTLVTTCLLGMLLCITRIIKEDGKRVYYCLYALCLFYGIYTIPSSVYWVLTGCIFSGIYFLITDKTSKNKPVLKSLILYSCIAAVFVFVFYGVIWLAIGSNLQVKNADSLLYGLSHAKAIMKAPIKCAITGIEYMLTTPYIQAYQGDNLIDTALNYYKTLSINLLGSCWIICPLIAIYSLVMVIRELYFAFPVYKKLKKEIAAQTEDEIKIIPVYQKDDNYKGYSSHPDIQTRLLFFIRLIVVAMLIALPLVLICTKSFPYYRVLSYEGVFVAFGIGLFLNDLRNALCNKHNIKDGSDKKIKSDKKDKLYNMDSTTGKNAYVIELSIGVVALIILILRITSFDFVSQFGGLEHELSNDLRRVKLDASKNVCVTDVNEQYLLKYLYDMDCENTSVTGSEIVLIDKRLLNNDTNNFWECLVNYEDVDWDYIDKELKPLVESSNYIIYGK